MSKHFPVVLFNLSTGTEDAGCINTMGKKTVFLQMWDIFKNNRRFSLVAMELEGKNVCINCREEATNCFCYKQNIEKLFSHVVVGMMMVQ